MFKQLLLPNSFKIIGWCLLIPATILGFYLTMNNFEGNWVHAKVFAFIYDDIYDEAIDLSSLRRYFGFIKADITNTVVGVIFIVGAMLVAFSKEKKEDEFINELRLSSLLWAVWINYGLLLLAFLFVYGGSFITVIIYSVFTVLIIFIARFNYLLYKSSKAVSDEK